MRWIDSFSAAKNVENAYDKDRRFPNFISLERLTRKIMFCISVLIACPDGWVENGSQCYFILSEEKEAFVGLYLCKQLGATLPIIKSAEENAFLLSLTEGKGDPRLGMVATKSDRVFEWLDGTAVADTFSAWLTGEPNNKDGVENCAQLYVSGGGKGKWNDELCKTSRVIVCQMEKK